MNRRQKIIVSVVGIFIVLLALVGLTYAYFLTQITGNKEDTSIEVITGKLELVYSDGTDEVNVSGIEPILTSQVLTKGKVKNFTISKTSESLDVYAKIKLVDLSVPEEVAKYDLKWALYQDTNPIATGDFGGKTTGEIVLATNQLINSTTGNTYNLHIWINETGLDQSIMMNKTISGRLDIIGYDKPENTLASLLLGDNNANVITTSPTFSSESTDRGLFVQQNDLTKTEMGFPTYYFKGNVTNNYVKFGTYQTIDGGNTVGEDIVWRVVRINEDGSIKLITENNISNAVVTSTSKYTNDNSIIKDMLDSWYMSNIEVDSLIENKVVKSSFCNDISGINFEYEESYGNAYTRLYEILNPIFTCPAGAIKAYEKVGLITADELIYAGGFIDPTTNNITYMDNNTSFWTLTPCSNLSISSWSTGLSFVNESPVSLSGTNYIRAVINLSPDIVVTGGDGLSADTAWIIG